MSTGLTVRTEALVCVAFVTLRQIHADAIVGARTRRAGVDFLAMRTGKSGAALALVALLCGTAHRSHRNRLQLNYPMQIERD